MGIEQIVEEIVSQVLESHVPQLRQELVQRVLAELPALGQAPSGGDSAANLFKAVSRIHSGGNQKEVLRALLEGTAPFCARAALFVVKGGAATGWQGRGFGDGRDEQIKDFGLDMASGLVSHAMMERAAAAGTAGEMDANFISHFGQPVDGVIVLPLLLKDKIAALVYADGGIDQSALELLVTATGAWLEVVSLRKQAHKDAADDSSRTPAAHAAAPSFSDPFAGHAPAYTAAAAHPAAEPVEAANAAAASASGSTVSVGAAEQLSPEDADTHRKAQRFARLLIDEIKLYNQAKVAEGRKHKDIYDRLKQDIEKSRSMYTKRYGNTAAASVDYFSAELVRSLAEDDSSLMGANFRR